MGLFHIFRAGRMKHGYRKLKEGMARDEAIARVEEQADDS